MGRSSKNGEQSSQEGTAAGQLSQRVLSKSTWEVTLEDNFEAYKNSLFGLAPTQLRDFIPMLHRKCYIKVLTDHPLLRVINYCKTQNKNWNALTRRSQGHGPCLIPLLTAQLLRNSGVYYQHRLKANEETIFL
jgi:hypothetical protein